MVRMLVVGGLFLSASGTAQLLQLGEELEYDVSYLGIPLGRIRVTTEDTLRLSEKLVARISAFMHSHPRIPFLSLRGLFRSWIDTSAAFSYRFEGWVREGNKPEGYGKCEIDYGQRLASAEEWEGGTLLVRRQYSLRSRLNDGLSILFAARRFARSGKSYRFPTIVKADTAETVIHFSTRRESVRISALPYPVRTVYFYGRANWTGIYGVTGDFRAWFSDDEARVPIRAQMRVYVGNVTIELIHWRRAGWEPPPAGGDATQEDGKL